MCVLLAFALMNGVSRDAKLVEFFFYGNKVLVELFQRSFWPLKSIYEIAQIYRMDRFLF